MSASARARWQARAHGDLVKVYGRTDGRTCAGCRHLLRFAQSRTWSKCNRTARTSSETTDWSERLTACGGWEAPAENENGRG